MQTQQQHYSVHNHAFYSQPLYLPQEQQQSVPSGGGGNLLDTFSRGSPPFPQTHYRYFSADRGSTLLPSGLGGATFDATNVRFAGSTHGHAPSDFYPTEELAGYQNWNWDNLSSTQPLQIPQLPMQNLTSISCAPEDDFRLRAPAAQRPTPAAMAVLLNPSGRSDGPSELLNQRGHNYEIAPALTPAQVSQAASRSVRALEAPTSVRVAGTQDTLSREKKHGCTMCHKRFDRPSTLKKHLLVHTGEKAFVCDTCGRRFGVASNLNRHVRRCVLKPVNSPSPNKSISGSPPAASGVQSPELRTGSTSTSVYQASTRSTTADAASSSSARASTGGTLQTRATSNKGPSRKAPGQKRRRRAPSPSRWIPTSLLSFNLMPEEFYRSVSVPLQPVRRNLPKEERDSWDENVGSSPYHPTGWKGILPGPGLGLGLGLGGKDVRNLNLGTSTGFMLGRVVFRDQA